MYQLFCLYITVDRCSVHRVLIQFVRVEEEKDFMRGVSG